MEISPTSTFSHIIKQDVDALIENNSINNFPYNSQVRALFNKTISLVYFAENMSASDVYFPE